MSEEENLDFPTTGTLGKSQEELADLVKKGDSSTLALIQKNRKLAVEGLQRKVEGLEETIRRLPIDAVVHEQEDGTVFNLRTALQEMLQGLQSTLTGLEAANSLEDMIIHDLAGCIKNLEQIGGANWQTGANLQVLIEVLKANGTIEETDMREMWNKLIPAAVEEMKKQTS